MVDGIEFSMLSCAQLGWSNPASYGSPLVCGHSKGNGLGLSCSGAVTFASAVSFCEAAGSRLCTATELENDETRGTGCAYDSQLIWSSTALGCTSGAFLLHIGGSNNCNDDSVCSLCADGASHHEVRCCADVGLPSLQPTASPAPTFSSLPTSEPTLSPTARPSIVPTPAPSAIPTLSSLPSSPPTVTPKPTALPTPRPTTTQPTADAPSIPTLIASDAVGNVSEQDSTRTGGSLSTQAIELRVILILLVVGCCSFGCCMLFSAVSSVICIKKCETTNDFGENWLDSVETQHAVTTSAELEVPEASVVTVSAEQSEPRVRLRLAAIYGDKRSDRYAPRGPNDYRGAAEENVGEFPRARAMSMPVSRDPRPKQNEKSRSSSVANERILPATEGPPHMTDEEAGVTSQQGASPRGLSRGAGSGSRLRSAVRRISLCRSGSRRRSLTSLDSPMTVTSPLASPLVEAANQDRGETFESPHGFLEMQGWEFRTNTFPPDTESKGAEDET
eukprot:CAMPEP_0172634476 /NCGR_PEP_ID=MMETSP1068-20121228/194734_1 /TAXON_ID=35684 /ORGANISM="Pseudopedinella elastica, Strain CCMP716" /LENGTH=503 /DNA_ID=CAMNT_0013446437 /DNA_START=12 /DNA_END=1523 /DNA_ORIENTATION=-